MKRFVVFSGLLTLAVVVGGSLADPPPVSKPPSQRKVQFARDIQPILSNNCFTCHGPDEKTRKAGLRLDLKEVAVKELKSGSRAVVPGDSQKSELVARIFAHDRDRMPPAKTQKMLKEFEKQLLKRWIDEGAEYQRHWAFDLPKRPIVPEARHQAWAKNSIDRFLAARLEAESLKPSPEADRYTLARRVAIDLTGLPPSLALVDRFVADKSPDAYEKYVDEILKLPAYGERWAHVWLDLARYADSNGYATDNPRTIWKYRDWVVDAINQNLPFDRFTIEQLAGDLLPNPTQEQLIATAFHRNTLTNDEGGTSDEEFRTAAVVDRVNTTMQVWMGLTLACAQCHDHKYDPFSQEEYFRLYAIFNQTEDTDRGDNSPLLTSATPEDLKRKAKLDVDIKSLEKKLNGPDPKLDALQEKWEKETAVDKLPPRIKPLVQIERAKRNPGQQDQITKYFRSVAPETKETRDRVAALKKEIASVPVVTTPIMRDLADGKKRVTKIHVRGNFLDQSKEVTPGVPGLLPPLPKASPANRLALARWLVSPDNPLTARVAVNRYWEQIFGIGLVETPEDFGTRGKLPTHPELLDWLATEFQKDWDVKRLLKLLVTSAAYRQSSKVSAELLERDPDNRLYARGPRYRSPAEVIRDQALVVSGLLNPSLHGPPVRPPQPKLSLTAAFGGGTDWETSQGGDKFRRALYTLWRRTTPYPSMTTFDAPARTVCTVSRPRTNTPLQALVTLNDPVFVEAAQALARRILKEGGANAEARATYGFRLCLTRPPRPEEVSRLIELYQRAREKYAANAKEAQQMATEPLGALPAGMDTVDAAAWTVVSNVLLNLDEMFAKR